jgi:hypothetical protein
MEVPKPTRDGFQSNLDKLAICKRQMTEWKLKASDPNVDKELVLAKQQEAKANFNVMIGIVARQFTTGIWKPATGQYVQKVKERRDLETELTRLTGYKPPVRKNEELLELNWNNLIRDYNAAAN